jgi:hypothetical protein
MDGNQSGFGLQGMRERVLALGGQLEITSQPGNGCKITAKFPSSSNREIAQALFLSEGTVRNHISHILTRLNLRDRTQAAIVATTFASWLENPQTSQETD